MHTKSTAIAIAVAIALPSLTTGCTVIRTKDIPHPMRTGKVTSNTIRSPQHSREKRHGLPRGVLTEKASLVELDNKTVCFEITLTTAQNNADSVVEHEKWHWTLYGNPAFAASSPTVNWASHIRKKTYDGHKTVKKKKVVPKCKKVDGMKKCHDVTKIVKERVPAKITVSERDAKLCFNHAGGITEASNMIGVKYSILALASGWEWNLL